MKTSFFKKMLPAAFVAILGFASIQAQAQCNPQVEARDGSKGTSATWCENEPIRFFENSPGYNTTSIDWDFGDATTSTLANPVKSYATAGTYTVKFTGVGAAGTCNKDLTITIVPSPDIDIQLLVPDTQCFEDNRFCFEDNSTTTPGSSIVRMTYLFSDGGKIDTLNPTFPVNFCYSFIDQTGGSFDMIIEAEDANGCVTKVTYSDYLYVTPKLGIEFDNISPGPNPGCDSTLGRFENISLIDFKDIQFFQWDFGDGTIITGDTSSNKEWWLGPNGDGIVEHWYYQHGTFDGKLTVRSTFGCEETFTWKSAVTNFVIDPVIIANWDSSCVADNPVVFKLKDGPVQGASQWLWNFGDPPSGPANFDDESWEVEHSYGAGPWMISLRVIAGPCDIQVYDTITKIGPGSTIEVPFVRVPEEEAFQCLITDSVHFVNNSSFRHNDPYAHDEDSIIFHYSHAFRVKNFPATGFDSLQFITYDDKGNIVSIVNYPITGTIMEQGYIVKYDATKDSLEVAGSMGTTYEGKDFYGLNAKPRYVFNFIESIRAGDQTAIPNADVQRGMNPHVWRVWDFGDQYAPQCTTDSRPWVNKNIGVNCNWSIDTLPVHWYTPWDKVYETFNNGNFYRTPVTRTMFNRTLRRCFEVNVYPDSTMARQGDTVLTIPFGTSYTYRGRTIGVLETFVDDTLGNWTIRRPPTFWVSPKIYLDTFTRTKDSAAFVIYEGTDTVRRDQWVTGRDSIEGCFTWTVTKWDMDVRVPAGVTVVIDKLAAPGGGGAGAGTSRTITGPGIFTIETDEQFTICDGDSLFPVVTIEENASDTTYALPSQFLTDAGTFIDSVFVDSAFHREDFFLERAQCFQVSLWHMDTVHPLACEGTSTKSLALIPPNARGMEIEAGIPCPLDGDNLSYYLWFNISETKPGCTQQYFAVNFDSLADPNNFIPYNGGVLAPPPPGSPLPFSLPYLLTGNKGVQFIKGYTPGEIGNDPSLRQPNGSFTIGLIVGNGQPDPNGGPPACLDTAWYHDMFRVLYLNADFEILIPQQEIKAICAGGDAYFRINEPIQDSISVLRWNWGYQGIGRGVNLAAYIEQFEYYEKYEGPSPTRNDKDVVYNGEDWLYNYIIRQELSDVTGLKVIDTLVTTIIKDWKVIADKSNADDVVKDMFEAIGLDLRDIPEEDVPLYLGPASPPFCLDTSGLSQFFTFGVKGYSERVDSLVYVQGDRRYRYTDASKTSSVEVAQILHFRDSSIQGYDTLIADLDLDGTDEVIPGVWKYTYRHPKIVTDPCDGAIDTVMIPSNGPMIPSLFLNNTVGCEKRGAALLNVGFLNDFWLDNPNICNGLTIQLHDTLRYWQYGDFMWPDDYPIDPRDLWNTPARYLNNLEIYEVDWDSSDGLGPVWERSIQLSHIYDEPGTYTITVHSKDSIGCHDTVRLTAYVTEVIPNFNLSTSFLNCNTIVDFLDSTVVNDPCLISPLCDQTEPCDSVIRWLWDFGDGTRTSVLQNPSHDYTQGGFFDVTLTVWTELGCEETIVKTIHIPGPEPEFVFENQVWADRDTAVICIGDSINIFNISGGEKIDPDWEMRWGDGAISNPGDGDTIGHTYDSVGTFELFLVQFDEIPGENIRCNRIFPDTNPDLVNQRRIVVIVLPRAGAEIEVVKDPLCVDELGDFIAHVDTNVYDRYTWMMGDGNEYNRDHPDSVLSHSYDSSGVYNITMIPLYTPPNNFIPVCPDTAFAQVTVVTVEASFTVDSADKPNFKFTDESINAAQWSWTFEDEPQPGASSDQNPEYNWGERVGTWTVCLEVTSPEGCVDDTCIDIVNNFQRKLIVYNVFTPPSEGSNGDDRNDEFVIEGKGLEKFDVKIYNRWGERVFHSDNIDYHWNGRVDNTGVECPSGTYYYVINYQFLFEEENEGLGPIESSVDLIRE
ncbi:MAG: PKD domain-containing protein [Bacteroidia bacterium]